MKTELIELLCCPKNGKPLNLETDGNDAQEIETGWLVSMDGLYRYPVHNGIPRFVPESNYADNFGMQWQHFRQTQLDSYSGLPISSDRFWLATNWSPTDLEDEWVLDVGCGAGRFAEVALNAGAKVVVLDYSSAVDACYANLKHHPNLHVVQGDIYALPFARGAFSFVYSLGVLQHTPNVAKAFEALPLMVKKEGRLCVDYYEKSWRSIFHPKFWVRPLTKRMEKKMLFSLLQKAVPVLLPLSRLLGGVPLMGRLLKRLVPVADHYGKLPLSVEQHHEWALLDTFDWLAPQYDQPQTEATARQWMLQADMGDIEVLKEGHLVARGTKPA